MKAFLLVVGLAWGVSAKEAPSLRFLRSGKLVRELTLAELTARIPAKTERFFDPRYGKEKAYRCLPIREVMELAYGPRWQAASETEAVLAALEGYASVSSASKLAEEGGCLAFEDAEVLGWEPVGRKGANPGPFYLSWRKPEQSTENGYPWPYQLASVNLVRFEERYPEVVPKGEKPGSAAYRGYVLFRGRCLRCHSINQQGGRIGPDLNAPRSVASYRDKETLLEFIRQPSRFRHTEMPDHTDLADRDLEDIYAYFVLKGSQPEKPPF